MNPNAENRQQLSRRLVFFLLWEIKLITITYLSVRLSVQFLSISLYFSWCLCNLCLLCYTVHDSSQFQESWLLSCPLSCPFFSKLHMQSRPTLVPSFFLEWSGVQVSTCGNDAREVPADWLIAKKPHDLLRKLALRAIKAVTNICSCLHSIWTVPLQMTKIFQDEKLHSFRFRICALYERHFITVLGLVLPDFSTFRSICM